MKILKLLIRILFKCKFKNIGKLEKGGCYIMIFEVGVLGFEDVKHLHKWLEKYSDIKLFALPVLGKIDKVKFI